MHTEELNEMRKNKIGSGLALIFGLLLVAGIGCTNYQIPGKEPPPPQANLCEDCHTDYDRLMEVYSPDTAAPIGGCGGEAPHYEPYDRVYMGGTGYDAFTASSHYSVGCTGCHNGDRNAEEKDLAHSGDFISHPSAYYGEKCATCHQEITDDFTTSIHNGTGQKRKVAMRAGLAGPEEFDQLPAHQIAGYDAKCAVCHGTCGNCHIVRPLIAGGGLADGHNFNKTPDMQQVCVKCHVSRGGHAYLGVAPGTQPDVHLTENGYHCLDCHDGHELHGDGQPVDQRYAYTELPECETCHPGLESSNNFHSRHMDDFQCQVCHSQDYNNCGACHIKDGHAEFGPYQDFKIAQNPLTGIKDHEFALVRRTLAYPDNWIGYGEELAYSNFDVFPTYNYTTPHNILRITERTDVEAGAACSSNCHIRNEGGILINSELYLWADSLETWEVDATGPYTVDGKLPSYWFN
jgi:hypothetical protein